MASLALDPAYRRIGVEEFLALDLRGAKAELIEGIIYMMGGERGAFPHRAQHFVLLARGAARKRLSGV